MLEGGYTLAHWQVLQAAVDYHAGALLMRRRRLPSSEYRSTPTSVRVNPRQLALDIAEALRPIEPAGLTVGQFFARWIEDRKGQVDTWGNDESVMRLHVLPALGALGLREVRPLHLVALVKQLRTKPVERKYADGVVRKLSPKSLYNIYGTVAALFRDAKLEDLVGESPCILTKHQLGEKVDSDPEWRATAIYSRLELERLLGDELVPEDRRVLYALEGIGALRHGEAAGLRFRNLLEERPLGMMVVARSYAKKRTKTKVTRYMPIHPALALVLGQWRSSGWERMMGRPPTADDLVVPLEPEGRRGPVMRKKENSWRRLTTDLAALGLRHRRGHDLRRTMISLARSDGADRDILRRGTHKPPKEVIEGYTTYEWAVLCREVQKFNINPNQRSSTMSTTAAALEVTETTRGATRIRTGEQASLSISPALCGRILWALRRAQQADGGDQLSSLIADLEEVVQGKQ